jgi:ApaG protein
MVQQVSKGIWVTVASEYKGQLERGPLTYCAFSYTITISNKGRQPVQLLSRYWKIGDALNAPEIVVGDGVVGEQPVLQPGDSHTYTSGCYLIAAVGCMRGHYRMVNLEDEQVFKVGIPTFQLHAGFAMN